MSIIPRVEIETVVFKVASLCNIDCSYCYVYSMGDTGWTRGPKQVARETSRAAAIELGRLAREQEHQFVIVLHGGEPLLLGAAGLEYVITALRSELPANSPISIQTNGTLITDEILDLCSRLRVDVSVSIDGPRQIHDRNRVGFDRDGTFDAVVGGIRKLQADPDSEFLFTGVLAVVDPSSDPLEVYSFFKQLGPPSVDFIYRDGNYSQLPEGKRSPSVRSLDGGATGRLPSRLQPYSN